MTDIHAGDLVIAVPIQDCAFGHPAWHAAFQHPEMDRKAYMVTWSGFSTYLKRPILSVAGRRGHFCAGCFAKQAPPRLSLERRQERERELSAIY